MTDHTLTPEQERELKAMEAGVEGRPVEADLSGFATLAADLAETRPQPDPDFTDRLDRAVEDRFPADWAGEDGNAPASSWSDRFRRRFGSGRRLILPLTAGFAGVLVVATVVVAGLGDSGTPIDSAGPGSGDTSAVTADREESEAWGRSVGQEAGITANKVQREAAADLQDLSAPAGSAMNEAGPSNQRYARAGRLMSKGRKVATTARITLGTDPDGVQGVANEIVAVTDEHNGIVMDSSVTDGEAGSAGARFKLSIPSGQVESAIAALSGIADLRARTQEKEDITAPFNTTSDRLKTSRARIKGLLGELETAYTETDRTRIENRLRDERWTARHLQQRMNRLSKRVTMTPVAVSVVTDENGSTDSGWGISDAFDDAGRLLGVAAGVTVIALAIAIPIGLMVLIVLAINRAWVNRARRRTLEGN